MQIRADAASSTPSAAVGAAAAADPRRSRLPALDVLRGVAILGTLLTNIWIFSGVRTSMAANGPNQTQSVPELVFQQVLNLTTDGKYIGLLTIMFGIGLEIQRQAAIRRGQPWPGGYPWRAGLLILDGLLNYIFIFEHDVLMGYGLTGLVVAIVLAGSPRTQKVWMGIGLAAHLAHLAYLSWDVWGTNSEALEGQRGMVVERGRDALVERPDLAEALGAAGAQADRLLDRGAQAGLGADGGSNDTASYWDMVIGRVSEFWGGRGEIPIMFTMGLGLFLVGAQLYRAGLFAPEGGRLRRRVMIGAFGVGLPIDAIARLFFHETLSLYTRYLTSALVSFGLLAAIAAFYAHGRQPRWLGRPFQLVGRMALTCYILQNLICSLIFYDFGLGLANRFPEHTTVMTMIVYVLVCAMLVTLSWAWLRRWSRGPVELVWHWSYEAIMRRVRRRPSARTATL